jgi:site-specific recombinase XerC
VVLFLAYTGTRWGEMAALRVGRIDFLRRRASIVESVTAVKGRLEWGTPKDHERRDLPLPRFLADALAAHVAGKDRDELVFTGEKGGVLRAQVFQRAVLTRGAAAIGVKGLHPHELRHTAASLAIASGANIEVVQTLLGHESATMTLDLYGHLFPDQLDELADAFDSAVAEMRANRGLPADYGLVDLPRGRAQMLEPPVKRGAQRGSPERIRTAATALRGRRPGPLDDGAPETSCPALGYQDSNLD